MANEEQLSREEEKPNLTLELSIVKQARTYFPSYKRFDEKITNNLRLGKIETRPANSNGLWCSILLPAILLNYNALYNVPPAYSLAAYVSLGLFLYFALMMVFVSISSTVFEEPFHGGAMACSLTATLLVYSFLSQDLFISLALTVPAVATSGILLRTLLSRFPNTYTVGEATIVMQGLALLGTVSLGKLIMKQEAGEVDLVNAVVYAAWGAVTGVISAFSLLRRPAQTHRSFLYLVAAAAAAAAAVLSQELGLDFVSQVFAFLSTKTRVRLILFWLSLLGVAVSVIAGRLRAGARADSASRKPFHALAAAVFAAGLLVDEELMRLAAGIAFAALLFVEALRKFQLEPYSSTLQSAFDLYADEKDKGAFAMTPLYLFVGLACPCLLVPAQGSRLELLSGALAIGVGDSAASWAGARLGRRRWPGSERTLEGTACNMLSQIFVVYVLQLAGALTTDRALLRASVAAVASSLVEARTSQVDNLILPLVSILALQATSFL